MMGQESPGLKPEGEAKPVILDDDGLPVKEVPVIKEKKSNISEEMMEDMKRLWDVFDTGATNAVPMQELSVIMRALDVALNDKEMESVIKQIDPEGEGVIKFERLLSVMEDKLKDIDTYEDLVE